MEYTCGHSSNALPKNYCIFCRSSLPKLLDICNDYINNHFDIICNFDEHGNYKLKNGIALPTEICEKFVNKNSTLNSKVINIFKDKDNTRLKRIKICKTVLGDNDLLILLQHRLIELEILNTPVSNFCIKNLTEYGTNLVSLTLEYTNIFSSYKPTEEQHKKGFIFLAPALKRLTLKGLKDLEPDFYMLLLNPFTKLLHLDLSDCSRLGSFDYTGHLTNLSSLVLYNVKDPQCMLQAICKLTTLRHLDISNYEGWEYENETESFSMVVQSLPELKSLDISGTNLAGTGTAVADDQYNAPASDIPGLNSRVGNPFKYLGLYETKHDACCRHDIPAKLIAGNANPDQILRAAIAFIDRPAYYHKIANEVFLCVRYDTINNYGPFLSIVLEWMTRSLQELNIQISCSATLFYIIKESGKELHDVFEIKRRIILTLLNSMCIHRNDETLLKNGFLTLCHFKIPSDVSFDYERLVDILLNLPFNEYAVSFVAKTGIYMLNSLACQVDGDQKVKLGDLGVIDKMLELIAKRIKAELGDDLLEVAWSIMWNVTDETPSNCQKFLTGNGMQYFLACLENFPDKDELLRNMMGLLGNVAEVQDLRWHLVTPEYLTVFSNLLDSSSDGIEVSYNAAGVISHIASDGPEVWNVPEPSRVEILNKMVSAIKRWDLNSFRNINYRSFDPILYLVKVYHTPECQHWALWALANLTTVYPKKYCPLVEKEDGLVLLDEVIQHPRVPEAVKHLAGIVIENCKNHPHQMNDNLDG